jgi:hypothetical protein
LSPILPVKIFCLPTIIEKLFKDVDLAEYLALGAKQVLGILHLKYVIETSSLQGLTIHNMRHFDFLKVNIGRTFLGGASISPRNSVEWKESTYSFTHRAESCSASITPFLAWPVSSPE